MSADDSAPPYAGPITLVGTATADGKKLVREVRGATISWSVPQPNTTTITRLDHELVLAVRDQAPYRVTATKDRVSALQGEKIAIPVNLKAIWPDFKGGVQVIAAGLPTGLSSQPLALSPDKEGSVVIEAKGGQAVPPGNFTVVLRAQTQPIMQKPQPMKGGGPPNHVQHTQPVAVTVVPKQLAKLSVTPSPVKAQAGKQVELTVKLGRQSDLAIPFKVEAIPPKEAKELSAKPVTVGPKEDEAKLVLVVAPDARAGDSRNVTIRATALFNDAIPVVHETKVTVNVSKK